MTNADSITTFSLSLIGVGAAVMALNIVDFFRLIRLHKSFGPASYEIIRSFATVPFSLMCFFFAGYGFVLLSLSQGQGLVGSVVVGLIFLGGAVFVQLTLRFQKKVLGELEHNRDQLRFDALHDPLTGLANRRLLLDRTRQIMLRGKRSGGAFFALVFMDLDRFKVVNDSLGHICGDQVLQEITRRLRLCVREMDTVARFGGDEFVLLLDGTSPRRAVRIVRRIRTALREPILAQGHSISINASYGIVIGPDKKFTPEQMLQNSTLALHRAKALGRDRIKVFKSDMLEQAVQTLAKENDLRRGISAGEISLHYQPIIAMKPTPHLAGFEALARWNHPHRGLLPPLEFITLAEETGLIIELGDTVIRQACRAIANWRKARPECGDLRMSINVSPRQFVLSHLARTLRTERKSLGLPAGALTLEITETTLMDNPDVSTQRLHRFREEGFHIAIDDFGQGYSSLAYIKDLPIDVIKIDRSFIVDIDSSQSDLEIVRCMTLLAHSLNKTVVAEGVETPGQLAQVQAMGCDYVQGFYFSRPVPEDEAWTMVLAHCSTLLADPPGAPQSKAGRSHVQEVPHAYVLCNKE